MIFSFENKAFTKIKKLIIYFYKMTLRLKTNFLKVINYESLSDLLLQHFYLKIS